MTFVQISTSGVRRITAKIQKFEARVRGELSNEIVDKGYNYALNIMPRNTGALSKALQKIHGKQSGKLRLNQPSGQRGRPYHLWMHGIKAPGPGGKGYDTSKGWKNWKTGKFSRIHTGYPDFMFRTREFMNRTKNETVEQQINNIFK